MGTRPFDAKCFVDDYSLSKISLLFTIVYQFPNRNDSTQQLSNNEGPLHCALGAHLPLPQEMNSDMTLMNNDQANVSALDQQEMTFRRRALRDAVVCIGWTKISSVICYMLLFFLSFMSTHTKMGYTIQVMTLLPIVPQVVLAVLLFLGAVEQRVVVLQIAIWLCICIGGYNALLGVVGFVFFIRTSYLTMHFLLAIMYAILAVSIFAVLCNDILIIQTYKDTIQASWQNDDSNSPALQE